MKLQNINRSDFQKQFSVVKQNNEMKNNFPNSHTSYTSHALNNDPKGYLNKMNISFGNRISIEPSLQKAIEEKDYEKILTYFGIEVEKDEKGMLTLSHFEQPDHGTFADYGIDEDDLFKQVKAINGFANFENSKAASLWNLKDIFGCAIFGDSKIVSLGELKYIEEDANFSCSEIESLGNLEDIGGCAIFTNSKIKFLDKLKHIGDDACFSDSRVESLGDLQCINGNVYVDENSAQLFDGIEISGQIIKK